MNKLDNEITETDTSEKTILDNKINNLNNEFDIFDMIDMIFENNDIDSKLENNQENNNKTNTENKNACKNCQENTNFIKNDGHIICGNCGSLQEDILDRGIEYNNENGTTRIGCPSNHFLPLSSMGTKIGGKNYTRMSLLHNRWYRMVYKERSLLSVLTAIEEKCKKYNINKPIIDNSKILFKKINDSKHKYGVNKGKQIIIRGINRSSLIAACIYHGAEMQGVPRSQKEIAEICSINVTNVTKGCRKFREILEDDDILKILEPSESIHFINRYLKILDIDIKYIKIANSLNNNIKKLDIASDHQPPSIAAGSIMLLSELYDLNINIKDISTRFKISEVTIKKTFKKIYEYKDIITNDELVEEKLKKLDEYYKNLKI